MKAAADTQACLSRRRLMRGGLAAGAAGVLGLAGPSRPAVAATLPFVPNDALVAAFKARRGGALGTGGRAAVAFRCDHHLNLFQSRILPLHLKYAIPLTVAAYSRMYEPAFGGSSNQGLPFPALEKLALSSGFEVANHGGTHRDASTAAGLYQEIALSRATLAGAMPRLPIELFVPAGVGGTNYQGFAGARSQADFQRYLAGRLIVQQHAVSTGYVPGYWPMSGDPLDSVGGVHVGIENADYATRGPSFIAAAKRQGRGVCFMYHPSLVSDEDFAALEGLFAWCAQERDAGRLEILTVSGLMLAKFGSSVRQDLFGAGATFKAGWNGWNGAESKWAIRSEAGIYYARRGALSGALAKDLTIGAAAGSTRQLRLKIRSTGGARVRVEIFDPAAPAAFTSTTDVVLASSGVFGTVHKYLTLPLTGSRVLRVRITPLSGGEIHVQHPELLAA